MVRPELNNRNLVGNFLCSVDLSLAQLPGKFVWNRRARKRDWITTLPVILRDLAPSSGFDPQVFIVFIETIAIAM
jgi:hypothetical protein